MRPIEIKNSGVFFYLIIIIYLITAFYSVGFHQPDEHYQILEFANYKLGLTYPGYLAWEFDARIRPCIQPVIALGIIKIMLWQGVNDPFTWALVLRLLSAFFASFTIKKFVDSFLPDINKKSAPYFIAFSYLLWFIPYINVRYSSENWSGILFLAVIILIRSEKIKKEWLQNLLIGTVMGFSILFRFQAAILISGSLAWLLFIKRISLINFSIIITAMLLVLLLGVALDSWFYDEWVITMLNYLKVNIGEDVASTFGTSPWYQYLYYILFSPTLPLGICIFISFVILIYKAPKNLIVWSILPFLIIHSVIPHKELRFLFQVSNFAPLIVISAWDKIRNFNLKRFSFIIKSSIVFIIFLNSFGLICASVKGAGYGKLEIAEYIHKKYSGKTINILLLPGGDPYENAICRDVFYEEKNIHLQPLSFIQQPEFSNCKGESCLNLLVISNRDLLKPETIKLLAKFNFVKVKESIPWISQIGLKLYDNGLLESNLTLFEFK